MLQKLGRIVVDSSETVSELCELGARFATDKSPYNFGKHRHPYTAPYDMLLSAKRFDSIVFGEIGIAFNSSFRMWRHYLPNAKLVGFEFREDLIDAARKECIPGTQYHRVDVGSSENIVHALNDVGERFDILIDDSSHLFEHQTKIVPAALSFMKPGGLLIIEDVFRDWPQSRYEDALRPCFPFFSSGFFVDCEHRLRKSDGNQEPYFNNDRLLVLCRNNRPTMPCGDGYALDEIPLLKNATAT